MQLAVATMLVCMGLTRCVLGSMVAAASLRGTQQGCESLYAVQCQGCCAYLLLLLCVACRRLM
jgi:hypothetical protein